MRDDDIRVPPFETHDLRNNLKEFLDFDFKGQKVGNFKFGIYAFFDYDGEPIYIGQTNEMLRTRIRRHLTNQRTDAVAMSVLDPFEVYEIKVWPLVDYDNVTQKSDPGKYKEACEILNSLEFSIFNDAIKKSEFGAVLNEKDPPTPKVKAVIPESLTGCIVSEEVYAIRKHPDFRIARRALILARLAQVISERQVSGGLRKTLLTQSKRLQWLAERRYNKTNGN
ncbi:GIY-YIG nuclease family protein [Paremcibacter congregatus]|uniref:GIY-YIG nuclease family protein n=1 Tax=Paremcibacter congregatus TaxID=2043170 RepID=UPI003A8FF765